MPEQVPLDFLGELRRTHTCGQLRASDSGTTALLMGWVHRRRDLGGVVLYSSARSRWRHPTGLPRRSGADLHTKVEMLGSEYVIAVEGTVAKRTPDTVNPSARHGRSGAGGHEALDLE